MLNYLATVQKTAEMEIKESVFLFQDIVNKFTFNYDLIQNLQNTIFGWLGANLDVKDDKPVV